MRCTVISIAITVLLGVTAVPAHAAGSGDGGLDNGPGGPHVSVGLEVVAPGGDGSQSYTPDDEHAPRPIRYEAVPAQSPPPGLDNLCNAASGAVAPGEIAWGWWYTIVAIDNATGAVLSRDVVCVPLPIAGANEPPPPPALPVPPTVGEIWRAVGLPAPTVGVSPAGEGVVGLPTWLWSGGPGTVQVAVGLDGYTVTGVATRTEYRFDAGDGTVTATPAPGSRTAPAVTHVYDVKGDHALRVGAVWEATVTMTGPGLPAPVPVAIGSAVVTATRDYGVVEVRSVLLP